MTAFLFVRALLLSSLLVAGGACATSPTAPESPRRLVPAGTEVTLELVDALDSRSSRRGDAFAMRLAEPVRVDGQLVIAAGAPVQGEVVHADRARGSGQPGELLLAARTLTIGDQVLALRGLRADAPAVGKDRTRTVTGVAVALAPAALMIRGGEKSFPAGSRVTAKLRDAVELPVLPEPAEPGQATDPAASVPFEGNP